MTTIVCEFCESCVSKHNIAKHKKSETCVKIQNVIMKHTLSYKLLKDENDKLKNTIFNFKKDIEIYKNQIKILEKSSEEYRKIVEKAATKSTSSIKPKQDSLNNMFEIDININRKQLNKTKYKDIPEDIIKNEIKSLKLKDNYQLEYREEDGYINITNLCKAGGKEFNGQDLIRIIEEYKKIFD